MNSETLHQANRLSIKINNLKDELKKWQTLKELPDNIDGFLSTHSSRQNIPTQKIPLEILKTLVIGAYEKEIDALSKEFESL